MENENTNPTNEDQSSENESQEGTEMHMDPGQEQHLPHEAWHVVQQKPGRVRPRMESGDSNEGDE